MNRKVNSMTEKETLEFCVNYLKERGYKIIKPVEDNVGKWIAFRQPGMNCILHGRIIYDQIDLFRVKNRSGHERWVELKNVLGFYDSRAESCLAE